MGAPIFQGSPEYDFAKISQKLHEIERIWGEGVPCSSSLDPPMNYCVSEELVCRGKTFQHVQGAGPGPLPPGRGVLVQ